MTIFAKYSYPKAGRTIERARIAELLTQGHYYVVDEINMGFYGTDVILVNYDYIFNSVFFDFYDSNGEKFDIFEKLEYNNYRRLKEEAINNE